MADKPQIERTIYRKVTKDGKVASEAIRMFAIDAQHAVTNFPAEYSARPWEDVEAEQQSQADKTKKAGNAKD